MGYIPRLDLGPLFEWVDSRRPATGAMGALYQQRRSLYWLVVTVGLLAYAGILTFLAFAVALTALAALQALLSTAAATVVMAYAWFGLAALAFGATVGATLVAARWASQYEVSE